MKKPHAIVKRGIKKINPHVLIAGNLKKFRENAELTQREIAEKIAELLDARSLLEKQLPYCLDNEEYPIESEYLAIIRVELGRIIGVCKQLREMLNAIEGQLIDRAVLKALDLENMVSRQMRMLRETKGYSQEQIGGLVTKILVEVGLPGPPGRAGQSKMELCKRNLSFVEAWAYAVAYKIDLIEILPPELADLLPNTSDPMRGWSPFTMLDDCRQYRHRLHPGILTLASKEGVQASNVALNRALGGWDGVPRRGSGLTVIERTENLYIAYLPDTPGCVAYSPSMTTVEGLIKNAIAVHLRALKEEKVEVFHSTSVIKHIAYAA